MIVAGIRRVLCVICILTLDCLCILVRPGLLHCCVWQQSCLRVQVHIDATEIEGEIVVFGLNGQSVSVTSMDEFRHMQATRRLASILYLYTLIPLVRSAHHFPVFAWCHDSSKATFSCAEVLQWWQLFWEVIHC